MFLQKIMLMTAQAEKDNKIFFWVDFSYAGFQDQVLYTKTLLSLF